MIPDAPYDDGINVPLRYWMNQLKDYVLRYVVRYHVKELTGTTGSTHNGSGTDISTVAHGLTGSKIVGIMAKVEYTSGANVLPGYGGGYNFRVSYDGTNVNIVNVNGDAANILSKSFLVYLTYKD